MQGSEVELRRGQRKVEYMIEMLLRQKKVSSGSCWKSRERAHIACEPGFRAVTAVNEKQYEGLRGEESGVRAGTELRKRVSQLTTLHTPLVSKPARHHSVAALYLALQSYSRPPKTAIPLLTKPINLNSRCRFLSRRLRRTRRCQIR